MGRCGQDAEIKFHHGQHCPGQVPVPKGTGLTTRLHPGEQEMARKQQYRNRRTAGTQGHTQQPLLPALAGPVPPKAALLWGGGPHWASNAPVLARVLAPPQQAPCTLQCPQPAPPGLPQENNRPLSTPLQPPMRAQVLTKVTWDLPVARPSQAVLSRQQGHTLLRTLSCPGLGNTHHAPTCSACRHCSPHAPRPVTASGRF